MACKVPPDGWRCTRAEGHDGPCAAVPDHIETYVPKHRTTEAEMRASIRDALVIEHDESPSTRHPPSGGAW